MGEVRNNLIFTYKKTSVISLRHCPSNVSNNQSSFKDTPSEKAPSNKTPVLTESINMDNWVVGSFMEL